MTREYRKRCSFFDYEPVCSHPTVQKKETDEIGLFRGAQWDSFASLKRLRRLRTRVFSPHCAKKETDEIGLFEGAQWDSNPRHSEPQSDALTN